MTLEYFEDGFEGHPLLLLHGGDMPERAVLRQMFEALAAGTTRLVRLPELPFMSNPGGISFTAASADVDFGVVQEKPGSAFYWRRTPESWEHIAGLLEAFEDGSGGGFQYLNDAEGPEVIYSTGRYW